MVSPEEAKNLLFGQVSKSVTSEIDISDAVGYVLAQNIFSPMDQPEFNNSSMDGYAIASTNNLEQNQFEIIGEIN